MTIDDSSAGHGSTPRPIVAKSNSNAHSTQVPMINSFVFKTNSEAAFNRCTIIYVQGSPR